MPRRDPKDNVLATNRKAFHNYTVVERYEAGIELRGTEVKSCRDRAINLTDGFGAVNGGELYLQNVHIAPFSHGNRYNHVSKQQRRLLLHKNQIRKLAQLVGEKGGTIVPLSFYLKNGLVKVEIAYCLGKTFADKRESMRKKQDEMEARRLVKR